MSKRLAFCSGVASLLFIHSIRETAKINK